MLDSASRAKAKQELTAAGKLRVGVAKAGSLSAFFVIVNAKGEPEGVPVVLGKEMAGDLEAPVEFLVAPNSGVLTDALAGGSIDVSFMPVDEVRKKKVDFGPAYFLVESTCLVPPGSPFRKNSDLDRAGVRVVGVANTTTIRSAERELKKATIISRPSVPEAVSLLHTGGADAFALSRDSLRPYAEQLPGSRILDGALQTTGIAVAVAKGRPAALSYVSAFVENAKQTGLLRRAFDSMGLHADQVAPPQA